MFDQDSIAANVTAQLCYRYIYIGPIRNRRACVLKYLAQYKDSSGTARGEFYDGLRLVCLILHNMCVRMTRLPQGSLPFSRLFILCAYIHPCVCAQGARFHRDYRLLDTALSHSLSLFLAREYAIRVFSLIQSIRLLFGNNIIC